MEKSIDLKKLLDPLPSEAITQHPTKTYLSSIKAIYVTERFNDVFGIGKWSTKVQAEHADFETGMIIVKVTFEVKELNIYYECFGGNDNGGITNSNFDLGDAYKGATTDAITKIGSYLGVAIYVFKGKSNPTKEQSKNPWLNLYEQDKKTFTKEAVKVTEKMRDGTYSSVFEIRKDYSISKPNSATLEAWFIKIKNES